MVLPPGNYGRVGERGGTDVKQEGEFLICCGPYGKKLLTVPPITDKAYLLDDKVEEGGGETFDELPSPEGWDLHQVAQKL